MGDSDSAFAAVWYWGEYQHEDVDNFLEGEPDGTFLVFHTGNENDLCLAVRVNGRNKFERIYNVDNLFGFTEPLNFNTLDDALDAYNWSPTETGNTLKYAGLKPNSHLHRSKSRSSRASLNEAEPLYLMRRFRAVISTLREKTVEYDAVEMENKELEERLQKLNNSFDSVTHFIKQLEAQIEKHGETFRRTSISSNKASVEFSRNLKNLKSKLSELIAEKSQVAEERKTIEQEKSQVEKQLAASHTEIQQIVCEKIAIRKVLLGRSDNPTSEVFLQCLMDDDLLEYEMVQVQPTDKSGAEKLLKSTVDGTFLVRKGHGEDKPFILSLSFMKKVLHFPVLQLDGFFGLDVDTCIFENIHELVQLYSRVAFSFHDEKYGTLTLSRQFS